METETLIWHQIDKEQPPHNGSRYLVTVRDLEEGYSYIEIWHWYRGKLKFWLEEHDPMAVIAWAELPTPYTIKND